MDGTTKNQSEKSPKSILVTVIGAVASIAVALISSGFFARSGVRESIASLKITEADVWEKRSPNVPYTSDRGGIVIAVSTASPEHRHVPITGYIENELIAAAAAQDSSVPGVPSIVSSSFAMPVPKGKAWIVKVPEQESGQVQIKWFTTKAQVTTQK